jgi:hypothetical protein
MAAHIRHKILILVVHKGIFSAYLKCLMIGPIRIVQLLRWMLQAAPTPLRSFDDVRRIRLEKGKLFLGYRVGLATNFVDEEDDWASRR